MSSSEKKQCWHYNDCGHEKDALCPAVHQKAGRSCWLVPKTLCGGAVHGRHARRIKSCNGCGFYIYMHTAQAQPSSIALPGTKARKRDILRSSLP